MKKYLISVVLLLTACGAPPVGQSGASGDSGLAGSSGSQGSQGAQGAPGTPGTGLTIDTVKYCSKIDNGVGPTLFLQYQIVTYSTGDKFLTCSITDNTAQYTNAVIYKASQLGAVTNICKLTYDLQNNSAGYWTFSSQADGTGINSRYLSTNSPYSGHTLAFNDTDCILTP